MSWTAGRRDGGLRFVTGACQERDAATKNRPPWRAGLISLCEKATDLCDWERRRNRKKPSERLTGASERGQITAEVVNHVVLGLPANF